MTQSWLLPQGIEQALPQDAARLESTRRRLLDLYASWGYHMVIPPFVDYLDSLLTGTGRDLSLQTFQLVDQLSGRTLGIRADMTPQVARMDAHHIQQDHPNRLCYIGTVLHTRPDEFGGSRSPMQVGAELFGHEGTESDVEILCLMLETFRLAGVENVMLDIGHVGIYRGLVQQAGLTEDQEVSLFEMLQRKAIPEIQAFVAALDVSTELKTMLAALAEMNGDESCLKQAREQLASANGVVMTALDKLEAISQRVQKRMGPLNLHFDLAELRGYHYHTGVVFAAYVPGQGQEIARGGRYDAIGEIFGRARPATGFSTDLKSLVSLSADQTKQPVSNAVFAPAEDDNALLQVITELREKGETIVEKLPGQKGDAASMGCDRELIQENGQWVIKGVK